MTPLVSTPSPRLTKGFVLAGLALAFATDTLTPLGFAHANLYPLIVAAAGFSRSDRWVVMAAVASLGLTVA
ncbi:hypothetical protein H6F75_26800, partial [Nodosilinea sp. FACHB-131]|uniref:hypothetical protein n=1 Tax=Cyanophyceae TaxID=3028117 RepID=UPI0016830351